MIFFHNSDFDHPERKGHGAKVSGSESSREQNGQGTKGPGSEMARERVDQGANRPECYWLIRSGERIGPGAKRLGTGATLRLIGSIRGQQQQQLVI